MHSLCSDADWPLKQQSSHNTAVAVAAVEASTMSLRANLDATDFTFVSVYVPINDEDSGNYGSFRRNKQQQRVELINARSHQMHSCRCCVANAQAACQGPRFQTRGERGTGLDCAA